MAEPRLASEGRSDWEPVAVALADSVETIESEPLAVALAEAALDADPVGAAPALPVAVDPPEADDDDDDDDELVASGAWGRGMLT